MPPKINICRPGYNASCALCCGSHNYNTGDYKELVQIFKARREIYEKRILSLIQKGPEAECLSESLNKINLEKKIADGIQCPFVSFPENDCSIIGCLAYNNPTLFDDTFKLFFQKTCKYFFCPARDRLDDDEIIFAAKITGDWYYYSLLINNIGLLKYYYRHFHEADAMPLVNIEEMKNLLKDKLEFSWQ